MDLIINLLLPHVVLTHVIIRNSKSMNSSILKLLHTNISSHMTSRICYEHVAYIVHLF